MSNTIEARVRDVLHNLNWLLDAHDSSVELIKIKGNKVYLHCEGECATCDTECIQVAFRERMPEIEVILKSKVN